MLDNPAGQLNPPRSSANLTQTRQGSEAWTEDIHMSVHVQSFLSHCWTNMTGRAARVVDAGVHTGQEISLVRSSFILPGISSLYQQGSWKLQPWTWSPQYWKTANIESPRCANTRSCWGSSGWRVKHSHARRGVCGWKRNRESTKTSTPYKSLPNWFRRRSSHIIWCWWKTIRRHHKLFLHAPQNCRPFSEQC